MDADPGYGKGLVGLTGRQQGKRGCRNYPAPTRSRARIFDACARYGEKLVEWKNLGKTW